MEIKKRLYKHRGDHRSHEKIDKEISIPCDKIITCHNKIRRKSEKDTKSVDEKVPIITGLDVSTMGTSRSKGPWVWWVQAGLRNTEYDGYKQAWVLVWCAWAGPSNTKYGGYKWAWVALDVGAISMSRPKGHWVWWIWAGLNSPECGCNGYKQAQVVPCVMDMDRPE